MHTTSPSLLMRVREPTDSDAWNRFVALYTPLLYHWSLRQGLGREEAADLVQDVLLQLVSAMRRFSYDHNGRFRAWLRVVLRNKLAEKRRRKELTCVHNAEAAEQVADDADDHFWEVEYRQQLVARALEIMRQSFEATTWKACWMLVVENQPARSVAEQLGISVGAVYIAKSRVLQRLRRELDGALD